MKIFCPAMLTRFQILVVVGALLFFAGLTFGDEPPIRIKADRMISQEQDNSVIFMGNVDAKQGETVIQCNEMTVYYAQQKKGQSSTSRVKKLICKGDVKVTKGDWLGTSKEMEYFQKERKVILSGNAQAWQGQNMVQGETITHYLDEKRSSVEQSRNKRVEMVIQQGGN